MTGPDSQNLDAAERERFDSGAAAWWDPLGPFRPLHELNPARLQYVASRTHLHEARVLDVGCGGGILAESLAARGAQVMGLDVAPSVLEVARLHLIESGLEVEYRQSTVENLVGSHAAEFDVVTCMEMLEHVPHPASVIRSIAALLRPGGDAFLSTLNRTPMAFLVGILGAEYIARLLPQGTHRYDRFIKPSELGSEARKVGLEVCDVSGLHYDPLTRSASVGGHVRVNYLMHLKRPPDT